MRYTAAMVRNGGTVAHNEWIVQKSGPSDADHAVLLLPGALESAPFYDDVLAEPALTEASIRFVATTLPGYAGARVLEDLSMENTAGSAGQLAADFGCDVVVGHSVGANVALEMAAAGKFAGPVVLLSPSFSRKDESKFPRVLDRLGRVLGHIPFSLMVKMIGPAMKSSLPPERSEALIAEMKRNDPRDVRRSTRHYLEYLDHHGSLVSRLGESGVKAWVVFGEHDDVGLSEDERQGLEAYDQVILVTIPDTGHFTLVDKPAQVAELVLKAVSSTASG
jgi:pimeloyl-ACP methyl ester carboxylesterase